jgi:rhodanese-related sulfurtransferase
MEHAKGFLALVNDAKRRVREISVEEVATRRGRGERLHIIDVREDDEWRQGHAAGAEHIGKGVIERDIEGKVPNHDEELILYCGGGFRSALAADALEKMGYRQVRSLAGGWRAWNERGLPVER